MKGDFSRFTFDPKNRYSRVLMQQGRVQLDADWNEQLDISAHRTETEITDFIGQSGAPESPKDPSGQSTSFRITANKNEISIGAGRYYVEGMLFENAGEVKFSEQPDNLKAALETDPGIYLAYLDVWQHHVTALEVPTIREAALGGADTTTRVKNVWQVKLHKLGELEKETEIQNEVNKYTASTWQPAWEAAISGGELTVDHTPGAITENQLYRVEIHQGHKDNKTTASGQVSFKWSRDNGAIAAQVEAINDTIIKIRPFGQDPHLAFPVGTLVEVSNEAAALRGQPGFLATVQTVQGNQLTVAWSTSNSGKPDNIEHGVVRRWDSKEAIKIGDSSKIHDLEQSIKVSFTANKRYKTGDYWLIPARALTGSIEWSAKPHGIKHRYCSLALLKRTNNEFAVLADCRSIFKPITSGLLSKAGDTMRGDLTIDRNLFVTGESILSGKLTVNNQVELKGANSPSQIGLTVNAQGNVGIGMTTPVQRLVIGGTGRVGIGFNNNSQTAALAINGNVGIGTINPSETLEIKRTGGDSGQTQKLNFISLLNDGGGASQESCIVWKNGANSRVAAAIASRPGAGYNAGDLRFQTAKDGTLSDRILINSEGNVGIGTTAPKSMLSVAGGVAIGSTYATGNNTASDGQLIVQNKLGIGTINPSETLEIKRTGGDSEPTQKLNFISLLNDGEGASQESRIVWKNGSTPKIAAAIASRPGAGYNAGDLRFQTAKDGTLSDRILINSEGNVGIGTTAPKSRLSVAGGVAIGSSLASTKTARENSLLVEGDIAFQGMLGRNLKLTRSSTNLVTVAIESIGESSLYIVPIQLKKPDKLRIQFSRSIDDVIGWNISIIPSLPPYDSAQPGSPPEVQPSGNYPFEVGTYLPVFETNYQQRENHIMLSFSWEIWRWNSLQLVSFFLIIGKSLTCP
jgi:hypothetical protein